MPYATDCDGSAKTFWDNPRNSSTDEFRINSYGQDIDTGRRGTKEWLDNLKRDDETWDEFLKRVTADEEPIEAGAWSDDEADRAKEKIRDAREYWR